MHVLLSACSCWSLLRGVPSPRLTDLCLNAPSSADPFLISSECYWTSLLLLTSIPWITVNYACALSLLEQECRFAESHVPPLVSYARCHGGCSKNSNLCSLESWQPDRAVAAQGRWWRAALWAAFADRIPCGFIKISSSRRLVGSFPDIIRVVGTCVSTHTLLAVSSLFKVALVTGIISSCPNSCAFFL